MVGKIELAKQFIQQFISNRNTSCVGSYSLLQDKEQNINRFNKRNKGGF